MGFKSVKTPSAQEGSFNMKIPLVDILNSFLAVSSTRVQHIVFTACPITLLFHTRHRQLVQRTHETMYADSTDRTR